MALFDPSNRNDSPQHQKIYAAYELAFTAVSFAAAVCFVVGSALFFDPSLHSAATWCFLAGSILFAVKPTLSFARELQYARMGEYESLAERANS